MLRHLVAAALILWTSLTQPNTHDEHVSPGLELLLALRGSSLDDFRATASRLPEHEAGTWQNALSFAAANGYWRLENVLRFGPDFSADALRHAFVAAALADDVASVELLRDILEAENDRAAVRVALIRDLRAMLLAADSADSADEAEAAVSLRRSAQLLARRMDPEDVAVAFAAVEARSPPPPSQPERHLFAGPRLD